MRKRGVIVILAAIPAWVFYTRFIKHANYELGSVAGPMPLLMRAVSWFALLLTIVALCLFAFDFIRWARKGPRGDAD